MQTPPFFLLGGNFIIRVSIHFFRKTVKGFYRKFRKDFYSISRLYVPLPKFPAVTRDISLLCGCDVPVAALEDCIRLHADTTFLSLTGEFSLLELVYTFFEKL